MFKAKSKKEIEKIIKENNLYFGYIKIGSYFFAYNTKEQFREAYQAIK
jgi:hypothetical protein